MFKHREQLLLLVFNLSGSCSNLYGGHLCFVLDKDIDEEYEYRQAAVISEVGGLDIILKRLVDEIGLLLF